jgi:hypothetical protein
MGQRPAAVLDAARTEFGRSRLEPLARKLVERLLGLRLSFGVDPLLGREMDELAGAWAASRPEFAKALHDAIDGPAPIGAPDFSPLSRKEHESERERVPPRDRRARDRARAPRGQPSQDEGGGRARRGRGEGSGGPREARLRSQPSLAEGALSRAQKALRGALAGVTALVESEASSSGAGARASR